MDYSFTTFDELKSLVSENGDVFTVTMEDLRKAQGQAKLGKHVAQAIRNNLAKHGLETFPEELPLAQYHCVRVYSLGTPVSDLFNAVTTVLNRDQLDENHKADQAIRESVNSDANATLDQIRQLVCD